jgi:MYXO-CTERM domain-containing protein
VGEPTPPPPPPPIIDSFAPDFWTIVSGEDVTLSWTVRFAESISINGAAVDPLELQGSQTHSPTQSTDYVLLAENTEGSASATVPVTVNATAQPVAIDSFIAEPEEIEVGESAELAWSVSNPRTLDINGQAVPPSGVLAVEPTETTEYILTANGHQGPVSQTVTVTVEDIDDQLDDRGGCMCGTSNSPTWLALGALLLLVLRRRRT